MDYSHAAGFENSPSSTDLDATPRTTLRRSISDAHLARANAPLSGPDVLLRDSLLGFNTTDGYGHLSSESFANRESFDRIFRVPGFPYDTKLFPNAAPMSFISHEVPQNEHDHHQSAAGDLVYMSPSSYRTNRYGNQARQVASGTHQQSSISEDYRTSKEIDQELGTHNKQRIATHSASNLNNQRSNQDQHNDELESTDGENLNSLQNMLSYVNKQIAEEEHLKDPASALPDSPSFAPLPETPQKSTSSNGKVQQKKARALPAQKNLPTSLPQQKTVHTPPKKKGSKATNRSPSTRNVSNRGVSRNTQGRQVLPSSPVKPTRASPGKRSSTGMGVVKDSRSDP